MVAEIKRITGTGARFALETSALPAVFREAVEALMPVGMCVLVGTARSGTEVTFQMPMMQNGRTVRGVIQGDSQPDEFIPTLVDLMMDGRLPAERMMTFYELADINRAAKDSSEGTHHQAGAAHAALAPKWYNCYNRAKTAAGAV